LPDRDQDAGADRRPHSRERRLLGSPCFEIPRAVDRDKQMSQAIDEATRRQRLRAKNRYNLITAVLFLLKNWFMVFVMALAGAVA
jgi:hypothetical protein